MLEFRSWVIIQVILLFLSPFNYHHPHSSFSEGTVLRAAWRSWRELAPVNPTCKPLEQRVKGSVQNGQLAFHKSLLGSALLLLLVLHNHTSLVLPRAFRVTSHSGRSEVRVTASVITNDNS